MSGGSYDYLCHACVDALFDKQNEIQHMADRLAGLGYAGDAARETQEVLLIIRQAENRIDAMRERLHDVWRAVEWWDSCDVGEDSVHEALKKYRGD